MPPIFSTATHPSVSYPNARQLPQYQVPFPLLIAPLTATFPSEVLPTPCASYPNDTNPAPPPIPTILSNTTHPSATYSKATSLSITHLSAS